VRRIARRSGAVYVPETSALLTRVESELGEYFAGTRREFTMPFRPLGTAFECDVWADLCRIPYGDTRSYADVARSVGRPSAVRAVGRANGMNALAILVPCHRVVASDGRLVGYGGGLWRKQRLLDLESP